ncbi:hypothetical protein QUF70_08920 [Desulfobacterales bacterium HSG17]|nr:hypothetical protein [Desulfobacterales bacterium HSG17]
MNDIENHTTYCSRRLRRLECRADYVQHCINIFRLDEINQLIEGLGAVLD